MRITGGLARGRRIRGPRGLSVRPSSDRVREALFDTLGARIAGSTFLDAYAGTGAVGVEALSRGADRVVFLERDPRAIALIRANLGTTRWGGDHEVRAGDAVASMRRLVHRDERFSLIFVDPPYDDPDSSSALALSGRIVLPGGLVVFEHRTDRAPALPNGGDLVSRRTYRYGDTSLTMLQPASARVSRCD